MPAPHGGPDRIYRDFITDGVPSSGKHDPIKSEVRAYLNYLEGNIGEGDVVGAIQGFRFTWSTNTSASDPGAGGIRINNAAPASATELYLSETDALGNAVAAMLAKWDDASSTIRGMLFITASLDETEFAQFQITGTLTDNGGWDTFNITGGAGTLPDNGDEVTVLFVRTGDKGDTGTAGLPYKFSTNTAASEPTAGYLKVNHAALASATALYISATDNATRNLSAVIAAWGASDADTKGRLELSKAGDPTKYAFYDVTAVTNNTTWFTLTVAALGASTLANDDDILVLFIPASDKGETGDIGDPGQDGIASGVEHAVFTADDTLTQTHSGMNLVADKATAIVLELGDTFGSPPAIAVPFMAFVLNRGAGPLTLRSVDYDNSPPVTINGVPELTFNQNDGAAIWFNGTEFRAIVAKAGLATTAAPGIVQVATDAEAIAKAAANRALSPANLAAWPRISVHKNGSDQGSITQAAYTKITWPNEDADVGAHFVNGIWTPPAGTYQINCNLYFTTANAVDNEILGCVLYKNGVEHKATWLNRPGTFALSVPLVCIVEADGDDTFEIYAWGGSSNPKTVIGNPAYTFLQGRLI